MYAVNAEYKFHILNLIAMIITAYIVRFKDRFIHDMYLYMVSYCFIVNRYHVLSDFVHISSYTQYIIDRALIQTLCNSSFETCVAYIWDYYDIKVVVSVYVRYCVGLFIDVKYRRRG